MEFLQAHVHKEFQKSEMSLSYTQNLGQKRYVKHKRINKTNAKTRKHVSRNINIISGTVNWNQALILNQQWMSYFKKFLGNDNYSQSKMEKVKSQFHKIDLHGALLNINNAKNFCLVNIEGIVLIESKNTFQVLVKDGSIKVVPKVGCMFDIIVGENKISCYGEQLAIKPYERFSKKIKKVVPPLEI